MRSKIHSHPVTAGLPNRLGFDHEDSFGPAAYSSIKSRGPLLNQRDHRQGLSVNGQSVSVTPNVARLSKNGNYGSITNVRSGGYRANNHTEEENCSDDSDLSDDRSKKRGSVFKKLSDGPKTDRAASLHEMAAQTQSSNINLRNTEDELSRLLRKLSLEVEESDLSESDFRDTLLGRIYTRGTETCVPMSEVVSVLQEDLSLSLTDKEQHMVYREFNGGEGIIDVKRFLLAAGLWSNEISAAHSVRHHIPKHNYRDYDGSGEGSGEQDAHDDDVRDGGRGADYLDNPLGGEGFLHDPHGDSEEAHTADVNHAVDKKHCAPPPYSPSPSSSSDNRQHAAHSLARTDSDDIRENKSIYKDHGAESDENTYIETQLDAMKLKMENELLKQQLKSFDLNFFEELEDLKSRHRKIQELEGVDPVPRFQTVPLHMKNGFHDSSYGPNWSLTHEGDATSSASSYKTKALDKFAWSEVDPRTALDRARLSSQLTGRRPQISLDEYDSYSYSDSVPAPLRTTAPSSSSLRGGGGGGGSSRYRAFPAVTAKRPTLSSPLQDKHFPDRDVSALSSLCERRLAVGLSNHADPAYAVKHIILRAQEMSRSNPPNSSSTKENGDSMDENALGRVQGGRNGDRERDRDRENPSYGYLGCAQITDIFENSGLSLSAEEINHLACGFASDGRGGVDCSEFCEAVKTVLYNLTENTDSNSNMLLRGTGLGLGLSGRRGDEDGDGEDDTVDRLLIEVGEGILDRERVRGGDRFDSSTSASLRKIVSAPFRHSDRGDLGTVSISDFHRILVDSGSPLTHAEASLIAEKYRAMQGSARRGRLDESSSSSSSSSAESIRTFKGNAVRGTILGMAKADPVFDYWIEGSRSDLRALSCDRQSDDRGTANINRDGDGDGCGYRDGSAHEGQRIEYVEYIPVVARIVTVLEIILKASNDDDDDGGLNDGVDESKLSWVLKEFRFLDALLDQLDSMSSGDRRRALSTLQNTLAAADIKHEGDVDGFCVLQCLLESGFKIPRGDRVTLLRSTEELGGKINYTELVQVLVRSCMDWTKDEVGIAKKIIRAMGVTVKEKRSWLARLRKTFSAAAVHHSSHTKTCTDKDAGSSTLSLSPASFLSCLRGSGISLTVEEEAALLDCLDVERLSDPDSHSHMHMGERGLRLGLKRNTQSTAQYHIRNNKDISDDGYGSPDTFNRVDTGKAVSGGTTEVERAGARARALESAPLIHYKSFLAFCTKHCGHWLGMTRRHMT